MPRTSIGGSEVVTCRACRQPLGYGAPGHVGGISCGELCRTQRNHRASEYRDCLISEQWSMGMTQEEIASYHGLTHQTVAAIIKSY